MNYIKSVSEFYNIQLVKNANNNIKSDSQEHETVIRELYIIFKSCKDKYTICKNAFNISYKLRELFKDNSDTINIKDTEQISS